MTEFGATYENKEHQITYKEFDTVEAFKKFTYDNRDTLKLGSYSGGTCLWKAKPNLHQHYIPIKRTSLENGTIFQRLPYGGWFQYTKNNEVTIYDTTEDDNLSEFFHQIRLYQEKRGARND